MKVKVNIYIFRQVIFVLITLTIIYKLRIQTLNRGIEEMPNLSINENDNNNKSIKDYPNHFILKLKKVDMLKSLLFLLYTMILLLQHTTILDYKNNNIMCYRFM